MSTEILFVINTLEGGGAERVISTLATYFHKHKYRVEIVCLNSATSVYKLPDDINITYLVNRKSEHLAYRIYYATQAFYRLLNLLIKRKPECVVSFMTTANLWTGLTCLLTSTNYIVSERTTPDHTINQFKGFLKWFSFKIYSNSKAIVLPAKGIEDCIKKNKAYQQLGNFKIIKNPVYALGNVSLTPLHQKKFILGVGRLSYEKGFDQLIAAFAKSNLFDTDLLIAGEGPEFEALNLQIEALKLQNRVKLIGAKQNLQDYYSQAQLFVLPSRNEGYPNALIEAMSMGCPCIAMDCEFGPSEIINHEKNGLLIEDKNIEELSKAIVKVLADPVLKSKLATNAKLINNTNSLNYISYQWEKLIFSIN
jgi:glycosyltransferase involved in cell wall biosynthesis